MLYQVPSDKRKRKIFKKLEFRKLCIKALINDQRLNLRFRTVLRFELDKIGKRGNIGKIRNRCLITGRGRAVYRVFGVDRFNFKRLANLGNLIGIEKTGW
jgi:small subunit ribosomal protein S14